MTSLAGPSAAAGAQSLAHLFLERAAGDPQRPAIQDGPRSLTYGELDAVVAAVAAELHAHRVGREEPVLICLPRSWQAVASAVGILRAGAACVPLSPACPALRQASMVGMLGTRLALTATGYDHGLPRSVTRIDPGRLTVRGHGAEFPHLSVDDLAYVLFTSGSTGAPKGVEMTHGNFAHLLCSDEDVIPRTTDAVLHVGPPDFDLGVFEQWGALVNGARVVLAPDGRPDPLALGRLIATEQVTFLALSAGMFGELVRAALPELSGVRLIWTGGDVLPPAAARALREAHPHVRLFNTCGPTEATVLATRFEVRDPVNDCIPIGRPAAGYRVRVLDEERRPVRTGAAGELWIGGPGVARGYFGNPAATAERFVPDAQAGDRLYRTGDRVRWREDGELLFLGRLDRQVKIAGFRVEPGEVERALTAHPAVREAAVVAAESVPGHKRLVAYAVPHAMPGPGAAELRGFLEQRLPHFMVPATIATVAGLPLTERSKVDRDELARTAAGAAEASTASPSAGPGEPAAGLAGEIATLMAELLRLPSVGLDESFFELGGDSLLAIGMVGRLRERLSVDVEIGTVFDFPTAAALADRIELAPRAAERRPRLDSAAPGSPSGPAPLSFAQRRAWLFSQMHPESIAYHTSALIRLEGRLSRDSLMHALGSILERHEIFRTAFIEAGDQPVQVVRDHVGVPLEEIDLRGAGSATVARTIRNRVRTRVDPRHPPLVRWTLLRLRDDRWVLVQVEHHFVHDGWSFAILTSELAEIYSASVQGRSTQLPDHVLQFRDYARWEQELAENGALERQITHWAATLEPDPPLIELPGARRRPGRESFAGGSVRRRMEPESVAALTAAARPEGGTLFMAAFAALAALLHHYTGLEDLQIGSGVANRVEPASRTVIGMIVNTVVLRLRLDGDPTVAELLRRVRRVALEAYANADAPFDAVVDALRPARDPARSPLFNVLFSFNDAPRTEDRWAGLETRVVQVIPNGTAKADLNIIGIAEQDGAFTFVWEHSDLLSDADAARIAGHHLELMAQFTRRPEARLSELDPLTDEERADLAAWRGALPSGTYRRHVTVDQLFTQRAAELPEAVAVSSEGGGTLTYWDLERRANRLAHYLRSQGVGHGTRIGVCLGRSPRMVVAWLAVLKAGGAYVPLDPADPPERLRRQVALVAARMVLTDGRLRSRVPGAPSRVRCVDELVDLDRELDTPPPRTAGPLDPAYVMFTSGSTGQPRAVAVPHRAIARLVDRPTYVRLDAEETVLALSRPAFDASTFEIWGPLLAGGRLVIAPPGPLALSELEDLVSRHGVTTMWLTAGLFHRVVDDRPTLLRGLKQLLAGGDVLSPDHVRRALQALPHDAVLVNGYGPTEATTFSCVHRMHPGEPVDSPVPIGRPIAGTSAHILDRAGRLAPVGMVGELYIGGDGVALGYIGDRQATRRRFLPDPFLADPQSRMYRTGDLARWRSDGTIEFAGRTDRQLKVRGFRIEPGEIEATLRTHPAVADVHVTAQGARDRGLVAYLVTRAGPEPTVADLRAHLGRTLPAQAIPSAWVKVEALPLNGNGKIDAAALPPPAHVAETGDRARAARLRQPLERALTDIWERALDRQGIGLDDDFFDLGGHSLLALEVFNAIEDDLGKPLPLALIFEAPTVARLADAIRADGWQVAKRSLVAVKRTGNQPPLFCVCAGDGNSTGFAALARRLANDQPVFALQPRGVAGNAPVHLTVERAAAHYTTQIRKVQRAGPYLLAGRCLGALVAYEMARRLEARGETVGLLAVLDSAGPHWQPRWVADGVPFDEFMNNALRRERPELDPFSRSGGAELMRWLAEPVRGGPPPITRYLEEVYRMRANLRDAFPDLDGADGQNFVGWSWVEGYARHGMCARLLAPPPPSVGAVVPIRPSASERRRAGLDLLAYRLHEAADIIAGRWRPGASARQRGRVLEASNRASDLYHAGPYGGVVTLIRSEEYRAHTMLDHWHALDTGGVVEVQTRGSHRSMLREPDVQSLAEHLTDLIGAATTAGTK